MKKTYAFKPLCLLTLIFDAILCLSIWRISSIASNVVNLLGSLSGLFTVVIFYFVGILGTIVMTVLLWLYYVKKEKVPMILWDAVLHTVISLFFIYQFMNLKDQLSTMSVSNTMATIINIIILLSAILHLFMLLRLDRIIHVNALDAYLPLGKGNMSDHDTVHVTAQQTQEQSQTTSTQSTGEPIITQEKAQQFFKSKNGKIVIGVVIVAIIAFVGYKVWDTFFNKITVDAFANMQVEFDGYDGSGKAYIKDSDIDYDRTNAQLEQFIQTISFDIEKNGELSNGDKVKVKAVYSQETAKQLKVVLKEETKEFEVSGLTIKYQNAAEIDKDIYTKAYNTAIQEASGPSYNDSTKTFYKAYYVKQDQKDIADQNNRLVFVFKETYTSYDYSASQDVEKTRYMYYYTSFDSSYDGDEYMYDARLYKVGSYDYVTEENDVLPSLQDKFSSSYYNQGTVEEVNISVS